MTFRKLLLGAAVLALLSTPVLAMEHLVSAVMETEIDGKTVLTDTNGMTLYTFDKDVQGQASNCYDEGDSKCATNWPPLFVEAGTEGEAHGDFTIIDRKDGTKIWAYKGWPLYLWIKDTAPGETTGDGVGGVWHTAVVQ